MASLASVLKRPLAAARAAALPGVAAGKWYGTPGLLVRGKGMMRVTDADTLVFRCALAQKEVLLDAAPEIYFETDHYKGWPAVLVRLAQIGDAELRQCVVRAWREVAPKKLVSAYDASPAAPQTSPRKAPTTSRRASVKARKRKLS